MGAKELRRRSVEQYRSHDGIKELSQTETVNSQPEINHYHYANAQK
jgi:hypothetical protein